MKPTRQDNLLVNRIARHKNKLSIGLVSLLLFILIFLIHFFFPSVDRQADLWLVILFAGRGYRFFDRITELGNIWLVLPATFVFFLILFLKLHREKSFHLLVTVYGGAFFGFLLKILFSPDLNSANLIFPFGMDMGFPSGHALMGTLLYGWLSFIAYKEIQNQFLKWSLVSMGTMIIFLIGISRLVISVHPVSDVLGGWAAGVFWLCISLTLVAWSRKVLHFLSLGDPFRGQTGD